MEFIEETTRRDLTRAWHIGLMHHTDPKKYPKRPEQLWNKNAGDQSVEVMKMLAIQWAENGHEARE